MNKFIPIIAIFLCGCGDGGCCTSSIATDTTGVEKVWVVEPVIEATVEAECYPVVFEDSCESLSEAVKRTSEVCEPQEWHVKSNEEVCCDD